MERIAPQSHMVKKAFTVVEMAIVLAISGGLFMATSMLISSTRDNIVSMSVNDVLATQGMEVMNRLKREVAQSAIIFTPDENTGDNSPYAEVLDFTGHPEPIPGYKLPDTSETMDPNAVGFDPGSVGNTIFFAQETAAYNIVIENTGNTKTNNGHGNNEGGNDPSNPGKKPGSSKEGDDIELHGLGSATEWFNSDGAAVTSGDSNFNVKRFVFVMYYISEFTNDYKMPTLNGEEAGFLNLCYSETGTYADFNDVDGLAEPDRSEVIAGLLEPVADGGAGLAGFWDRTVDSPSNATPAFYTFVMSGNGNNAAYVAQALASQSLVVEDSEILLSLSGTMSTGRFSVAYNTTPLKNKHQVPLYAEAVAGDPYPGGFEIMMTGNKQERRIHCRLVTCVYERSTLLSQESSTVAYASEASAASGVFYHIGDEDFVNGNGNGNN